MNAISIKTQWNVNDHSHSAKWAGSRLHLSSIRIWPDEDCVGWLWCPGKERKLPGKRAHTQFIREARSVVSDRLAVVDWSRPKESNLRARTDHHKKKRLGRNSRIFVEKATTITITRANLPNICTLLCPDLYFLKKTINCMIFLAERCQWFLSSFTFTYPLTAGVAGAPQMTFQPVSSIFLCSPLPPRIWRTRGLSIPRCSLPTSSPVCLVV